MHTTAHTHICTLACYTYIIYIYKMYVAMFIATYCGDHIGMWLNVVATRHCSLIGIETIKGNGYGSVFLFRCRNNTLKLRWRQGFEGGPVGSLPCGKEMQTVNHFVIECDMMLEIGRI